MPVMKEIIDGVQALGGQDFRKTRADPFDILNSGGGFQHLKNGSRRDASIQPKLCIKQQSKAATDQTDRHRFLISEQSFIRVDP